MTGARPETTRVTDLTTHFREALPDVVTLGQLFKNHGYFVQGMGKIYHGGLDDPATWSVPWQTARGAAYARPENLPSKQTRSGDEPDGVASRGGGGARRKYVAPAPGSGGPAFEDADVPDDTFQDGKVARLAAATLRDLSGKSAPFFLAVGFVRPHLPFVAPKKYWDLYDPEKIALAPNKFRPKGAPEYAVMPGGELRAYRDIPAGSIPDDLARRLRHGYYAAISYVDAQIGLVLDELDRLGLREKTIVVLWGDHGWKLGEHDAWCKHSNCENDTNAPLLLSAPGMKHRGMHAGALVEFVDIYPTLADLAGLPLPGHLEGKSLRPLLDDPRRPWKQAAFSQYPRNYGGRSLMGYSMRTDRYRFTVWLDRSGGGKIEAIELYDHQADPQENTNIATEPGNAALVQTLTAQWRAGWRAALPDESTAGAAATSP
ncbi:Iduronate sulfatase [uncultured Defluviicoccus sp.]|uniref:Iduronate sulfatase n=1 Tax=metagenome TaxID=256318 RepID=A0A380TKP3_9ZZZZ|nr:Iduronate sulfatase [uncultured Defluviicoccus sp.]